MPAYGFWDNLNSGSAQVDLARECDPTNRPSLRKVGGVLLVLVILLMLIPTALRHAGARAQGGIVKEVSATYDLT
jgi:hypothetical protein